MIRFAWMQTRLQTAVGALGLAIVAVVLAVTGPHLLHLYHVTVTGCQVSGDCAAAAAGFLRNDHALQVGLNVLVVVVPAILGVFWGAPLVARELENGTARLAWTQSVSRVRWLAVRLGVAALASMAIAGLLSLMVTWWSSPADRAGGSQFASFDYRGVVPVGYAAFGLVLGVTLGLLIRRTVPAMAATLGAFVAVRLVVTKLLRPHLISPLVRSLVLNPHSTGYGASGNILLGLPASTLQPAPPSIPGAWLLSVQVVNRAGQSLPGRVLAAVCPKVGHGDGGGSAAGGHPARAAAGPVPAGVQQALQECVSRIGRTYHEAVTYQPASRYWAFQWYELAIFLAAAVLLGGFCLWRVRR